MRGDARFQRVVDGEPWVGPDPAGREARERTAVQLRRGGQCFSGALQSWAASPVFLVQCSRSIQSGPRGKDFKTVIRLVVKSLVKLVAQTVIMAIVKAVGRCLPNAALLDAGHQQLHGRFPSYLQDTQRYAKIRKDLKIQTLCR